jgi:hypothetical protein
LSRATAIGVLGLVWLINSPCGFSQTGPSPSRDRRLDDALVDITLLKRLVKDQERRIADLEKVVKNLQAAAAAIPEKPAPAQAARAIVRPAAARWHNPLAWAEIREGMSRAQVEEILGPPTSVDSVIDYQTLVYKGDVADSGTLTGTIKLTDDRVSQVNPPDF